MSIRRRLLLALLSALFLVGLGASGATWYAVHEEAKQIFDDQLRQLAYSLRDQTPLSRATRRLEHDFVVQVLDARRGAGFETVRVDGEDWRIFSLPLADGTIQVAAPLNLRRDRSLAMALRILVPILATFPLFALLIWLIVGEGLKPLEDIAGAIRRRAPGSLEPLPDDDLPEEVAPMVRELNALLARLRESLEAQKRFTADAAHELRTPLTALQIQLQLVERASSPEERRQALETLKAAVGRAARLVEQMLAMARLEPDAASEAASEVDLRRVAASALAECEPLAEAKRVELRLGRSEAARLIGRGHALHMLVRNLIDNAVRYTPPGGSVQVRCHSVEAAALLEVIDTGPGIAADDRARVFDRFYRRANANETGTGLGLAIVKAIAVRHGAQVILDDAPSGGLHVTVSFPRSS